MAHTLKKPSIHIDLSMAMKAIDCANDGITIVDLGQPGQPLVFINKSFEKMTGYQRQEVIGKNCNFLQGANVDQSQVAAIREAILERRSCRLLLKNYRKDGTLFWNELSLAPIEDTNYYIGIQKDVTNEIVYRERVVFLSEHDELTGLYNYRGFFNNINYLIHKAIKENLYIGLGIADIDFFKLINDQYGHVKGNTILQILGAEMIHEFVGDVVGRFGGDEFCFTILTKDKEAEFFYQKIANCVNSTNSALSDHLKITMSAGIAIEKASHSTRLERLIHLADNIMYENKQRMHHQVLMKK